MAGRIAGTCFIKADGEQFEIKGGVETPISQLNRETVMSLTGNAGYKEMAQRQFIKFTGIRPRGFSSTRKKLETSVNLTVTAEMANGEVYTLAGAYLEGETVSNGEEGTIELEFSGTAGIWR